MESAAAQACSACGDDARAACRACSYALCRACLDEDTAEGRTTCARCGGEYAVTDPGASRDCVLQVCRSAGRVNTVVTLT
jgi:cellulose synthase A